MKKNTSTNNGGRPRKGEKVKAIIKHVRFSPEEEKLLTDKVQESGLPCSSYIREAALAAVVKSRVPKEVIKILSNYEMNLRNIGTNLNLIAHKANAISAQLDISDVNKAIAASEELWKICTGIKNKILR